MQVNGASYELVVARTHLRIYRSGQMYLRIGAREYVKAEEHNHRQLILLGFPVPTILAAGEHEDECFFVEQSAGDETFGDIFDSETERDGAIRPASFAAFCQVVLRWSAAQLAASAWDDPRAEFARLTRRDEALRALPSLALKTQAAFERASQRLNAMPAVLCHADFHAYNICAGGVIDFEETAWGYAGHDVLCALLAPRLFPPSTGAYRFTDMQSATYLNALDAAFAQHGLALPSKLITDYRVCALMALVGQRRRPPEVVSWLDEQYAAALDSYLS